MSGYTGNSTRRRFLAGLMGLTAGFPSLLAAVAEGEGNSPHALRRMFSDATAAEPAQIHSQQGAIEFESSDTRLTNGFQWAKAQALSYVRDGDPVGPWYEAALPGRNAFCMRDVSHMSTGAQLLGLGARTMNMLRQFADHISLSKKWCTWWEITGDGKPAPVDYNSDTDFWYDLPASFDVLDACYRQWLWTTDSAYVSDDVFLNYYRRTVTDYVQAWDHNHNGLLEHLPGSGHMGIATYDEDLQDQVLVGADLIAAQYAAYRAYAAIARHRSDTAVAAAFTKKADNLKALYNAKWWDSSTRSYYGALGEDGQFHRNLQASTGGSDIEFPLYFELTDDDFKTQVSLNRLEARFHLDEAGRTGIIGGVEGISYLPDIFYKYGRSQSGCTVLLALMNPNLKRRTYPEVSYSVIGNLATGLMGIKPSANAGMIETFPQLSSDTQWAALHHVPFGNNAISVRHTQDGETALTNEMGPELIWHVGFPGKASAILVNGTKAPTQTAVRLGGVDETYCMIHVAPGDTRVARARAR